MNLPQDGESLGLCAMFTVAAAFREVNAHITQEGKSPGLKPQTNIKVCTLIFSGWLLQFEPLFCSQDEEAGLYPQASPKSENVSTAQHSYDSNSHTSNTLNMADSVIQLHALWGWQVCAVCISESKLNWQNVLSSKDV